MFCEVAQPVLESEHVLLTSCSLGVVSNLSEQQSVFSRLLLGRDAENKKRHHELQFLKRNRDYQIKQAQSNHL